jgi:hypothetical protein
MNTPHYNELNEKAHLIEVGDKVHLISLKKYDEIMSYIKWDDPPHRKTHIRLLNEFGGHKLVVIETGGNVIRCNDPFLKKSIPYYWMPLFTKYLQKEEFEEHCKRLGKLKNE